MIALILVLLIVPTEAERLFELGNTLYAEQDISGAVAAYEGALATGWTSAALERNLGLAHAEAGRIGHAVLHTERARRLDPGDGAIRQNLQFLQAQRGAEPEPVPPAEAVTRWLAERIGAGVLAGLAFMLYLGVLGLVGFAVWNRTLSTLQRRALVVLVPLLLFVSLLAIGTSRYTTAPQAVVTAETALLRNAPTPNAGQRGEAAEGTVLPVTDRRGAWLELRLADGTTGWASADDAELL